MGREVFALEHDEPLVRGVVGQGPEDGHGELLVHPGRRAVGQAVLPQALGVAVARMHQPGIVCSVTYRCVDHVAEVAGQNDIIVLDGLQVGERIVTAGLGHLREGLWVRPL